MGVGQSQVYMCGVVSKFIAHMTTYLCAMTTTTIIIKGEKWDFCGGYNKHKHCVCMKTALASNCCSYMKLKLAGENSSALRGLKFTCVGQSLNS